MSKKATAFEEAKSYLRSAKASLDAGDEGPCISNLFYVVEHLANILKEARNGKATKSDDEKQSVLRRAHNDGVITAAQLKACNRIYDLRITAQQHPYLEAKGRTLWKADEVEQLYLAISGLLDRVEQRYSN